MAIEDVLPTMPDIERFRNEPTGDLGTGPAVPITIPVTTLGDNSFSDLPVPPGVDVILSFTGAGGGGGGGGDGGEGASGGGGGASVVVLIPAATWAANGNITIVAGGAGATVSGLPGSSADLCILEMSSGEVVLTGGGGGDGSASTPGAGGTVTHTGTGFTILASFPGNPGQNAVGTAGGAGGAPGFAPGGAGGKGGDVSPFAGADGGAGFALVSFNL